MSSMYIQLQQSGPASKWDLTGLYVEKVRRLRACCDGMHLSSSTPLIKFQSPVFALRRTLASWRQVFSQIPIEISIADQSSGPVGCFLLEDATPV